MSDMREMMAGDRKDGLLARFRWMMGGERKERLNGKE